MVELRMSSANPERVKRVGKERAVCLGKVKRKRKPTCQRDSQPPVVHHHRHRHGFPLMSTLQKRKNTYDHWSPPPPCSSLSRSVSLSAIGRMRAMTQRCSKEGVTASLCPAPCRRSRNKVRNTDRGTGRWKTKEKKRKRKGEEKRRKGGSSMCTCVTGHPSPHTHATQPSPPPISHATEEKVERKSYKENESSNSGEERRETEGRRESREPLRGNYRAIGRNESSLSLFLPLSISPAHTCAPLRSLSVCVSQLP